MKMVTYIFFLSSQVILDMWDADRIREFERAMAEINFRKGVKYNEKA